MNDRRRAARLAAVVALLVGAAGLGVLAFAVPGGWWLLLLAALCLGAVIVIDRAMTPASDEPQAEGGLPQVVVIVLAAVVAVALVIGVFMALHTGSAPAPSARGPASQAPAAVAPPASGAPSGSAPPSAPGVSRPGPASGSAQYVTAGADVHLRAAASTDSEVLTTMPAFATTLTLSCYQAGQPVFGAPYWYRTSYNGVRGYVSELWINAGADPGRTGLPPC